jgi:hypothetical protein
LACHELISQRLGWIELSRNGWCVMSHLAAVTEVWLPTLTLCDALPPL